ncbi:MAG: TetR/AcrR family transcriptional regulator [Thermomicrobiales bacterium]|nr:TetR/AcrR family transcriptional regulator [Thermomicrobiales bacterium]
MKIQERSKSRRQRLLDAALTVFTEQGYNQTPIDDIARASETSKGGVYFHFPSKQALFLALLDESRLALLETVEAAMAAEADPLLRGEAALRAVIVAFAEHRLLARLLLVEAAGAGREFNRALSDMHEQFAMLIASCLDEAVAAGRIPPVDTRLAARAWYGAVNQIVLHWLQTGHPENLETTFPLLRDLLLFGVVGREEAA